MSGILDNHDDTEGSTNERSRRSETPVSRRGLLTQAGRTGLSALAVWLILESCGTTNTVTIVQTSTPNPSPTPTATPTNTPSIFQNKWYWCTKCQGLHYDGFNAGVCPAGGGHSIVSSYNYTLAFYAPGNPGYSPGASLQRGWAWCTKCQGLHYMNFSVGVCPAGGGHSILNSREYSLLYNTPDAVNQPNWAWCTKCQGLHYTGFNVGVCPAGGGHSAANSYNYDIAIYSR
jgi:hypothetical protein